MDEAKVLEVLSWLRKARQDLLSAFWLLESPDQLYSSARFHSQQAAEKSLKAYLTWFDQPFGKMHSIVALVALCLPFDPLFENLRTAAVTLTPLAVGLRYPGDLPELSREEALHSLELANQVWNFVMERLPPEISQAV